MRLEFDEDGKSQVTLNVNLSRNMKRALANAREIDIYWDASCEIATWLLINVV